MEVVLVVIGAVAFPMIFGVLLLEAAFNWEARLQRRE